MKCAHQKQFFTFTARRLVLIAFALLIPVEIASAECGQDLLIRMTAKSSRSLPGFQNYLVALDQLQKAKPEALFDVAPKKWVKNRLPGLYESIPSTKTISFQTHYLSTESHGKVVPIFNSEMVPFEKGGATGSMVGNLRSEKHYSFIHAHFETGVPPYVSAKGIPDLVPGKGTPTQVMMTLHQLKRANVKAGTLADFRTTGITNCESILELLNADGIRSWIQRHPGKVFPPELIQANILSTQTGRHIQTVLTQTGHRITQISVEPDGVRFLSEVLEEYGKFDGVALRALVQGRTLAGKWILNSPDQLVPFSFKLHFKVAPKVP